MDSIVTNQISFHEFMLNTKPWCLGVHDYCPLVIGFMSLVILISLMAIVYICVKNRHLLTCYEIKDEESTVSTSSTITLPGDSSSYQAAISNSHSQIPIVFPRKSAIRLSPPSYNESQTQTQFHVRQTSSRDNTAFILDEVLPSNNFTHQKNYRNASFMSTDSFVFSASKPKFQRSQHFVTKSKCFLQPSLHSFEIPPSYDEVINSSVRRMNKANYDILSEEHNVPMISEVEFIV
jgi:hypothetical protein